MSFKEITSDTAIGNRALAMVSETKTITSLDDPGSQAQAVKRWYKPIVARLLEMHHWGLATKRASLVAVDNARSSEWLYAFATPIDMAFPVGISIANGLSTVSYYRGLAGLLATSMGQPMFLYQHGVIYSNMTGDLEYVSFDITEADFTSTFEHIVILMLASRLALELPKDYDLSKDLETRTAREINIAMAQNLNAGNRRYGQQVSETELVRGTGVGSWDYFPLPPGW